MQDLKIKKYARKEKVCKIKKEKNEKELIHRVLIEKLWYCISCGFSIRLNEFIFHFLFLRNARFSRCTLNED